MPQIPTSPQVLLNNAAKDDVVGLDGDFNFTIADLLGNDPGGAAKVSLSSQFFFGDEAPVGGGLPTIAAQVLYLANHGITANLSLDGESFVSFDIGADATDIKYFTQIGNKGTWSQANVEVNAPVPGPGESLFAENFDGYDDAVQQTYQDGGVNVFAALNLAQAHQWAGVGATDVTRAELGADGYGGIAASSGGFWFDTQASPGQMDVSHTFTDTTAAQGGVTSVLSFDVAKQSLDYAGNHYETASDAAFEFRVDGVTVAHIDADDLAVANVMEHFEIEIAGYALPGNDHTLELIDVSPDSAFTGFAVDSILLRDWTI